MTVTGLFCLGIVELGLFVQPGIRLHKKRLFERCGRTRSAMT